MGILRRAQCREKPLPPQLHKALLIQAGLAEDDIALPITAFAANQRDEVRDCAGALCTQTGIKRQTSIAESFQPSWDTRQCHSSTTGDKSPTLADAEYGGHLNSSNLLFTAGVVTKGNGDCFLTSETHTSWARGGGQAGQGYPCILTAGFSAGAASTAGSIGYSEETAPTLKGSAGGSMMPSILCLNDQGGQRMDVSADTCGTLRAQMDGHPPLVLPRDAQLYENYGIDSRIKGPLNSAPTLSARAGTGGNNLPLVNQPLSTGDICISGNIIDRQVQNGGNGIGFNEDVCFTLTATDRHAVFSRQRSDEFLQNSVTAAQAARQHKDATDLVCDSDNQNVLPRRRLLIRRLTPLECERLQGFPDGWTNIPGATQTAPATRRWGTVLRSPAWNLSCAESLRVYKMNRRDDHQFISTRKISGKNRRFGFGSSKTLRWAVRCR